MKLTQKNYYGPKASQEYMSVSQFKDFLKCPAMAMAKLNGEYVPERGRALLLGSLVDEMLTGTKKSQDKFIEENRSELFKKNGDPYADVEQALETVERVKKQPLMMHYLKGGHQKIMTGEIEGVPFKIKMDVNHPKRIVDLKTVANFKPVYKPGNGRMNFVEAWGYTLQGAIYQAVEGHNKPFYINAITKEDIPDIATIHIEQPYLDAELAVIKDKLPYFDAIKTGAIEAPRCEHCAYCKSTRRQSHVMTLDEFELMYFEEE